MAKPILSIAGLSATPGERAERVLELTLAGTPTRMPLFLLNGAHDGPTVVVTAGIHGAEYVGIEAAMRLARRTDPRLLRGQLIIAPISSMTAFARRAIYLAPPDNKNLNRCFPGDPNGSFAEQLAAWIFQNLIRRADYYFDLHGGDMNEALVPFSIVKRTGDAALNDTTLRLAAAFGIPLILAVDDAVKGGTFAAAADAGVPAVLAEIGGQGLWPEHEVQAMLDGLHRGMAHIGALDASAPAAPSTRVLEEMIWLRSQHDGLFYPECAVGDEVEAGQVLGRVTNFLGDTMQVAEAPVSGTVLFLVTTLAMNHGDPLLSVGA
jgi:predicted deacylase